MPVREHRFRSGPSNFLAEVDLETTPVVVSTSEIEVAWATFIGPSSGGPHQVTARTSPAGTDHFEFPITSGDVINLGQMKLPSLEFVLDGTAANVSFVIAWWDISVAKVG